MYLTKIYGYIDLKYEKSPLRNQGKRSDGASPEKTSNPETKSFHNVFEVMGALLYA